MVKLVKELAIYNDKGLHWKSHGIAQIIAERKRLIQLIVVQLTKLDSSESTEKLNAIIQSGALAEDDEGKYIDLARSI